MSHDIEALGEITKEVVTGPIIVHKGVYTLWRKPDGTLRIQYRRADKDEDDFFELPGAMVALAESAAQGKIGPMEMMKAVMSFMKNGGM
jgi:hypothetical protein